MLFRSTIFGTALLIVPGLVIWLFGIYDAYVTAKKMKYGKIPFEPANLLFMVLYFVILAVMVVALAAAIIAIIESLHGASPLSLLNISGTVDDTSRGTPVDWLENTTQAAPAL